MLKPNKRQLDGLTIYMQQLPPMLALPLFVRTMQFVAPVLPEIAEFMARDEQSEVDPAEFVPALVTLATSIDQETMMALVRDLLNGCRIERDGVLYDMTGDDAINKAFAGKFPTLMKTLGAVALFQFRDFSSGGLVAQPSASKSRAGE